MKKSIVSMFAAAASALFGAPEKPSVATNSVTTADGRAATEYRHVVTPEQRQKAVAKRAELREAIRRRLAAMTPEQLAAFKAAREKRLADLRERAKASPRRVVRRTRDEDGTITLERADGTIEIHRFSEK